MQHFILGVKGSVPGLTQHESRFDPHYEWTFDGETQKLLQLTLGTETIDGESYELWQVIVLDDADGGRLTFQQMRTLAGSDDSIVGPWSYAHFAELYPALAEKYLEDESGNPHVPRIVAGEDAAAVMADDYRPG